MLTFHLEIITPEKIAFTDEVTLVTAPTELGIIGVLPRHVPLFTRLVQGELKITKGKEEIFLAIGGGFMEVSVNKVVILVTEAFNAGEINEMEILSAKKRAEEALRTKPQGEALQEAQYMFQRSVLAMKLLKRKRGMTH